MEISKEKIFNIGYSSTLGEKPKKKEHWTSRLKQFIKENKLITMTLVVFLTCIMINFILIFNFIKIFEKM